MTELAALSRALVSTQLYRCPRAKFTRCQGNRTCNIRDLALLAVYVLAGGHSRSSVCPSGASQEGVGVRWLLKSLGLGDERWHEIQTHRSACRNKGTVVK